MPAIVAAGTGMIRVGALALLVALVWLAASLSGPVDQAEAAKRCGTYKSTSIYDRARVIAIRGVSCRRAVKVARRYDRRLTPPGRWRCGLAHGGGRTLFSCGKGGTSGDLRDWPHALKAKGVGRPG